MLVSILSLSISILFAAPVGEVLSESMGELRLEWDEIKASKTVVEGYSKYADCTVSAKVAGYDQPESITRVLRASKKIHVSDYTPAINTCTEFAREAITPLATALANSSLLQSEIRAVEDSDESFFDYVKSCHYNDVSVIYFPGDSDTWEIKKFATVKRPVVCP